MKYIIYILLFFPIWVILVVLNSIISRVASFLVPITELDTISSLLYFHDICNLRFCPFFGLLFRV